MCNLQNLKEAGEFESHSLRQSNSYRFAPFSARIVESALSLRHPCYVVVLVRWFQ